MCQALDTTPHNCIYIGDGNDNELPAAAALGMHTIRTLEHANSDPSWGGPTVTEFAGIRDLL